ncbi:hypothetical protein WH52_02530 [Tenacibaculum holothuriorum]|uniref:Uncharacterized protein n=1 Tax=Tenacibaculum holothuriorum TaxID=1635173 RepID=A0A1Y2PIK4_9FLAO|nr:hypothetical protein [Tenacibaculum holothuriorum]OSY89528.1 hypothetical protein WH52_02530 [Tenacibaculum holothuriorum]
MYTLSILNNYTHDCTIKVATDKGASPVYQGQKNTFENLGNAILKVPGMGVVNFIDLAATKIKGHEEYPKEHWGVLVRTHTVEGYYRYEGGGELTLTIDELGSYTLTTQNGTMIMISLPELTIN